MRQYNKYKDAKVDKTPIFAPMVTTDFHAPTGVNIRIGDVFKPLDKYIGTCEFTQAEYDKFLNGEITLTFNNF